jgi:hypothetical protein
VSVMDQTQQSDFLRKLDSVSPAMRTDQSVSVPSSGESSFLRNLEIATSPQSQVRTTPSRLSDVANRTPQTPVVPEEEKTWSETFGRSAERLVPSTIQAGKDIIHAISHPIETGKALGQLGKGIYSKAEGALGASQDAESKAQNEALLNAFVDEYVKKYGSVQGFKKALAEDPASILADASLFITGGTSAIARGTGLAGKTTGMAGAAAKALEKTGKAAQYLDPLYSSVAIPGIVSKKIAGPISAGAAKLFAGESYASYRKAAQAGFSAPKIDREAFVSHLTGKADEAEIVNSVRAAFGQMQKERSDNFFKSMQDAYSGNIPNTTYGLIDNALDDARKIVYNIGASGVAVEKYQNAARLLNEIEGVINFYKSNSSDPAFGSLKGAHSLKVTIGDRLQNYRDPISGKVGTTIYNAVRDTIAADPKIGPKYMKTMEDYGKISDDLAEISGTLGLGKRNLKSTSLKKILSVKDNQTKRALIDELAKRDSRIPFMIAGNELHDWLPGGLRQAILGTSSLGHLGVLGPLGAAISIPAQAALHSPRVMANLNYAAGRLGAGAAAAVSPVGRAALYGATAPQRTTEEQIEEPSLRKYLETIGMVESAGDTRAVNRMSNARGRYQFMPDTWENIRKNIPGLPSDPTRATAEQQFQAAAWLTNQNMDALERLTGRKPTYADLGLAHYFGASGAAALMRIDQNTRFVDLPEDFWQRLGAKFTNSTLLRQNPNLQNQTVRGIRKFYEDRMRGASLASGGRVARASGGRIIHEDAADKLIRAAEIAKKNIGKQTETILEKPDEHVVQALAVANRHI